MMRSGMSAMSDMGGMGGMNNMNSGAFSGGNNSGISATNSVGFNYRDQWSKRISVYGSYSYNHKNTSQLQTSSTQSFYQGSGNTSFINDQDINNLTNGKKDTIKLT